jgi:hypothetical protein
MRFVAGPLNQQLLQNLLSEVIVARREWNVAGNGQFGRLAKSAGFCRNPQQHAGTGASGQEKTPTEAKQSTPYPPVKREERLHLSAALAAVPAGPRRAEWMTVPGQDASSSDRNSAGKSRVRCRMRTTVTASADASNKMT